MTSGSKTHASVTPDGIMARFEKMIMRVSCLMLAAAFFCLSPMFPGEAAAQKTQSMSVTVNSFTTLDKVGNPATPSFEATESDFLESVGTPTSVSSKSWSTVEVTSKTSNNHLKLRGQSNQGNFSVSAKVSSADSGFKGIKLALDLPGNANTNSSEVTFDQTGSAKDVIGKGGNGAVVFGINYEKIEFNGNTVGDDNFNLTMKYTISNTQLGS
jgi:hypothetical protein